MNVCSSEQEYINAIAPAAQRACKRYGYLASILIGQACLENGFGIRDFWDNPQIELLLKANNMVGIKSSLLNSSWDEYTVWEGQSITKKTPEEYNGKMVTISDQFRVYDTVERSFCDFLLFLKYASNYGKGGTPKYGDKVLSIKDPETLIKKVASLGYATGSSYPSSVMRIVNRYNLTKYDDLTNVEPSNYVRKKEEKTLVKKLSAPRFIDNRAASKSQIPAWRSKSDKKYIVIHYLGVVGQNFELWDHGYGATFTIAWNGDVYQTADYTAVTWQCGGGLQGSGGHSFFQKCTNYNSVSIETCVKRTDNKYEGDDNDDKWYFTEESQESLVWAVSKMMDDLNIPIENVIRHYDVTGKICPNPYVRNNGLNGNWTWTEFKANLAQYRKNGTIIVPDRSAKKPEEPTKDYLSKGDRGTDVKEMQLMLNSIGYNCGTADGVFGEKTESALVAFRKAHGMTETPKYTQKVKDALKQAYSASGDDVKKMQTMLNALGYNCGKVDGVWGKKTEAALSAFRVDHKMTATPKYTDKVKAALTNEYNKIKK